MSALADELRASAQAQSTAADALFQADDFNTNPLKQATAIIGKVNSTVFAVAAKLAEQHDQPTAIRSTNLLEKRLAILKQNDEIRQAAASGDWSKFDTLVSAMGAPSDGDGQQPVSG